MFEQFITWEMLATYSTLVAIVFMVVEFTKEVPYVKDIRTKYYSSLIAFVLIVLTNLHGGQFALWNLVLYFLSAIAISLTSNGLSDFNNKVLKDTKDTKE